MKLTPDFFQGFFIFNKKNYGNKERTNRRNKDFK